MLPTRSALLAIALLTFAPLAMAGPLFPCPKAVSSENGSSLVISDVQLKYGPENRAKVEGVSLQVFSKKLAGIHNWLATTSTYWGEADWSVSLDSMPMHNEPECPLPLITNDGEFLILLHVGPVASPEDVVLQIYRWDHRWNGKELTGKRGMLVREIRLREVWSPLDIATNTGSWTGESSEWFFGGTFKFSDEGRQLLHRTRWGYCALIRLEDGSVTWLP